jgi:hypothetical protein
LKLEELIPRSREEENKDCRIPANWQAIDSPKSKDFNRKGSQRKAAKTAKKTSLYA